MLDTMKQGAKLEKYKFAVLAADVALFSLREGELVVRLIKVERPPYFDGVPGLPGGLVHPSETAEATITRIIKDKALVNPSKVLLEQLYTFSKVDRDPRGRVVAVGYLALVPWESLTASEQGDSKEVYCHKVSKAPKLAYDHDEVLRVATKRLASRVSYTTVIAKLLAGTFTLTELENAYESILNRAIDKRNFRKKVSRIGVIESTGKQSVGGRHRPALLYRFKSSKVEEIEPL